MPLTHGGDNKLNTNKSKVGFKMIALHEHYLPITATVKDFHTT